MDPRGSRHSGAMNEVKFGQLPPLPIYLGQNFMNGISPTSEIPSTGAGNNLPPFSDTTNEDDLHEDYDFSDEVLRYVSKILMEEDVEDQECMLQESLELQVAEKSLYDAIGKKYPPSPDPSIEYSSYDLGYPNNGLNYDLGCPNNGLSYDFGYPNHGISYDLPYPSHGFSHSFPGYSESGESFRSGLVDPSPVYDSFGFEPVYQTPYSTSSSVNSGSSVLDDLVESPESNIRAPELCNESQSVSCFIEGVKEASKFMPRSDELIISVQANKVPKNPEVQWRKQVNLQRKNEIREPTYGELKVETNLKHVCDVYSDEQQRSSKQAAMYTEHDIHSDIFDEILLHHAGDKNKAVSSLREALQSEAMKKTQQTAQAKGTSGGRGRRGRRRSGEKDVVDFRTLLINCAQAVAADDRRTANELLKQIRQTSSPFGDGNQRIAHYLANGLEARLAGTGTQIYRALMSNRISASDVLKAYLLYLAACPFKKLSNYFSNRTISKLARGEQRIHIIDFGILYGFQWPTFIQRQALRSGGPPNVRITGIDFPQPGFRQAERVEETGRRLAHYAKEFNVPFEFNPIAKRWETIQIEDLKVGEDELVVVNFIDRMKNLPDETMAADSSRNAVLKMIRKVNPALLIQGVVNGAYNAPFFVSRFKEALFHFSSIFDMLETIIPREYEERLLLERDILGREALNVVACEGWERVERPEAYRKWQARTLNAGFVRLPLDPEVKGKATARIRAYHKDFVIDEESQWLLMGWKGRMIHALSTWKPG